MPRGDGTGPTGKGPATGRGTGGGASSAGRGRTAGRGRGQPGECMCPQCGTKAPHEAGVPCLQMKCPQCGTTMVRA